LAAERCGCTIRSYYVTQLRVVANYSRDGRGEAAKRPGKPRKYEGRGFLTLVLRCGLLLRFRFIADALSWRVRLFFLLQQFIKVLEYQFYILILVIHLLFYVGYFQT